MTRAEGPVSVAVANNGVVSAPFTAQLQAAAHPFVLVGRHRLCRGDAFSGQRPKALRLGQPGRTQPAGGCL